MKLKNNFLDFIELVSPGKENGFYLTMRKQTSGFNGLINLGIHQS
jgi:hypothetical protein